MNKTLIVLLILGVVVLAVVAGVYLQKRAGSAGETVAPSAETTTEVLPAEPSPVAEPAPEEAPAEAPAPVEDEPEAASDLTRVRVYGVVLAAETDAPVEEALVRLAPDGTDRAVTDANGAYSLELQTDKPRLKLDCAGQGLQLAVKEVDVDLTSKEQGGEVELRVDFYLKPGTTVTGRITDAATGAGIAGVTVRASQGGGSFIERMMSGSQQGLAVSEENGEYILSGLEPASVQLIADGTKAGYALDEAAMKTVSLTMDQAETRVDFALNRGGIIRGTVTLSDGGPAAGAEVAAMPANLLGEATSSMFSGGAGMLAMRPAETKADETGAYEIKGLRLGKGYRVSARLKGHAAATSGRVDVTPQAPEHVVDLKLSRGSNVSGKARYDDGAPAAGVALMLMPDISEIMQGNISGAGGEQKSKASDAGLFEFSGLAKGKYTLMREPADGNPMAMVFGGPEGRLTVEVDGDNDVGGLLLTLKREDPSAGKKKDPEQKNLEGRVVAPDGSAAAGVTVQATSGMNLPSGDFMPQSKSATTDEDGVFKLAGLTKDSYDLKVKSPLGNGGETGVRPEQNNVLIRLAPPTRLRGQVLNQAGDAVAGCAVTLKAPGGGGFDLTALMGMGGGEESVNTDEFGFFEFPNVEEGEYSLDAKSRTEGTGSTDTFSVVPGRDLLDFVIRLTPGVGFSGAVYDSAGATVAGATVSLRASGGLGDSFAQFMPGMQGSAGSATSGDNGEYSILRVAPGTYTLSAQHADFAPTTIKDVVVETGRNVTGFDVVLNMGGCVEGVVLQDGVAKAGIMVQMVGVGGMQMVQTDEEGRFEKCGIPEGSYVVQAVDPSGIFGGDLSNMRVQQKNIEVLEGQTTVVDFGPTEGTVTVTGQISGPLGSLTTVTLRRPGGPAPEELDPLDMEAQMEAAVFQAGTAMADASGAFVMEGVEPGEYFLEVLTINMNMMDLDSMANMDPTPQIRMEVKIEAGKEAHYELAMPE